MTETVSDTEPLEASRWVLAPLLVGLWAIGHGYVGVAHDARLYLLQAMARLDPAAFGGDLFLAYGSQDSFTIFTRLWAPLLSAVGPIDSVRVVGAVGLLAWWWFALILVRRMEAGAVGRWAAVLFLVAVSPTYGGGDIFRVGEHLATARVWSEALALLCCWSLVPVLRGADGADAHPSSRPSLHRRAVVLAVPAGLLAAAVHPLMAAPMLGVLVLAGLFARGARWTGLGVLSAVAGAVFMAALLGFEWTARFDPAWWQVVRERSPHLFVANWLPADFARLLVVTGLAAYAARAADTPDWVRRLAGSAVFVAWMGVVGNAVGADGLRLVFVTQLQLFRFAWPLHVLGPILAGAAVGRLCQRRGTWTPAVVLLVVVGLGTSVPSMAALVLPMGLLLACAALPAKVVERALCPSRSVTIGLLLTAAAVLVVLAMNRVSAAALTEADWPLGLGYAVHESRDPLILLGATIALGLSSLPGRLGPRIAGCMALLIVFGAIWSFDQRRARTRAVEQGVATWPPLPSSGRAGQAFWQEDPIGAWLLLGRPSYFTPVQGAGVVFSRETAMEYQRRRALLGSFAAVPVAAGGNLPGGPAQEVMQALCADEPAVEWIALKGELPWPADHVWRPLVNEDRAPSIHLFRCDRDLR